MDRRSFFLTALLPVVAAKKGVLGLHHPVFRRELVKDRILIMKARGLGWSRLIAQQQFAIYNGHKGS